MPSTITNTQTVQAALASQGDSSQKIYDEILDLLDIELLKSSGIIDVGMGQGKFLANVHAKHPTLCLDGADVAEYPLAVDIPVHFNCADFNQNLEISKTFDLVTSIEVIEHLRDPRHFVSELAKICKTGGTILITTPNNESWSSLLSFFVRGYFSAFSPRDYPAHITPIFEHHLRQVVAENKNLRLKKVHYFHNGRIPGTNFKWHSFFPFLSGKRYADNFAFVIEKVA